MFYSSLEDSRYLVIDSNYSNKYLKFCLMVEENPFRGSHYWTCQPFNPNSRHRLKEKTLREWEKRINGCKLVYIPTKKMFNYYTLLLR